jgi:hypothetical protein
MPELKDGVDIDRPDNEYLFLHNNKYFGNTKRGRINEGCGVVCFYLIHLSCSSNILKVIIIIIAIVTINRKIHKLVRSIFCK